MSSLQKSHPLPPPPPAGQQQQQQQQQPYQQYKLPDPKPGQQQRSKSSFSLRSDKSHKSSGSIGKTDLHETSQEKASRRLSLSTKADPRLAMQEAEPSAIATGQATSLAPLRAIQHLDAFGNPIADPDRSNPTRSRWERPLDTIRSFEAAIDGNYSRKSYIRPESADAGSSYTRRSSYAGGGPNSALMGPKNHQDFYTAGRPNGFRQDNYVENRGLNNGASRPESYYDNNARTGNGYYPSRARYPRTASEPQFGGGAGIYPVNGNQQSYETVTTASGSGSSGDPLGYSTDPSSDNSSLDRVQPPPPPPEHNYSLGYNGYGGPQTNQTPSYALSGYGTYPAKQMEAPVMNGGYQGQNGGAPVPPRKESNQGPPRVPIKLGPSANGGPNTNQAPRPGVGEKRKSWFGRRFSRA